MIELLLSETLFSFKKITLNFIFVFSTAIYTDVNDLINHMNVVHSFNYFKFRADMKLGFYQQV